LSHEEYTDVHFVCGFVTVLPLPLLNNISYDLLDDESPIDLYSLGFNSTCEKKKLLPSANGRAERQVQRSLEEGGNIIDMVQGSPRTSTPRVSARLSVPRKKVSRKLLYTEGLYPYHIKRIQHLKPVSLVSRMASCSVSNANP